MLSMGFLDKLFGKNTATEEPQMTDEKLNIGIILSSTREGRVSPQVGEWVKGYGDKKGNANYEIVDIKEYDLPFLGTGDAPGIAKWNEKLASLDGFIFVVAEYNHSITGALKNAMDLAREAWYNKSAGIVSYGSTGGARAAEHLRGICGELNIADVRTHPTLSLFLDFENGTDFKPQNIHDDNMNMLLDQVVSWGKALKTVR